jgi:membrane-bound inhibitor of C-type lysozyme
MGPPQGLIILRMKFTDFANAGFGFMLAASLAGCGTFSIDSLNPWSGPVERPRTSPADGAAYACDGARRLVIRNLADAKSVMIVFPEREFRLDQAPSAASTSGARHTRYTNGSTTLQSDGDQASLEEEGAVTYSNCRRTPG